MENFTFEILLLLFFCSILAGTIDTISGGGGLITMPVLLLSGIPPLEALGTNKFQASAGTCSASYYFIKNKVIDFKKFIRPLLLTMCGASIGTLVVQSINTDHLSKIIPFLLILICFILLLTKRDLSTHYPKKMTSLTYGCFIGSAIGFYDGILGPGAGTFYTITLIYLLGFTLVKATAHAKILNFSSNVTSLMVFMIGGHVVFMIGLLMAIGQWIGAFIGVRLVIKLPAKTVKYMTITISIAMSIILFAKQF